MVVRWSHICPWKAIAENIHLFIHHTHLVVGNERKFDFGKIYGWVINHFVCCTRISIESFLREI